MQKNKVYFLLKMIHSDFNDVQGEITRLLQELNLGHTEAWAEIIQRTYPQLCHLSSNQRSSLKTLVSGDTLDTKSLVHEAFLSLYYSRQIEWKNRLHFYMTAAKSMRYVLLNRIREKGRYKRGYWAEHVTFDEEVFQPLEEAISSEKLFEALESLSQSHPRGYKVVHLRFFLTMRETEIAELMNLSTRTIIRDWLAAKALLSKYLASDFT